MTKEDCDSMILDQAAKGCCSGDLSNWSQLVAALKRVGIDLPLNTHWFTVQKICQLIIKNKELQR